MKKIFKRSLKIISVLIGLFLIVSILVAVFVDINHYKDNIVELLESETGLSMEINGDLNLSIVSGLQFKAEDIKLSQKKALIADIEFIDLGVALLSMYRGDPQITSLELKVRDLNIARDKYGNFNFLPLLAVKTEKSTAKTDANESKNDQTDEIFVNNVSIKNINLSLNRFSYMDDLESYTLKLDEAEVSLSLLPIIQDHKLVIDDPKVLVAYSYSGKIKAKQVLSSQYQLTDLSLDFNNKKGDFFTDKFSFNLLQRGENHSLPPLMFGAEGRLQFKMVYPEHGDKSEYQWDQADLMEVVKLDVNLSGFKWNEGKNHLDAKNAKLVLDEVSVFDKGKITLENLMIHSLSLDSNQVTFVKKGLGEYRMKNIVLQLNDFPAVHKGKPMDLTSEAFFKQFSQRGKMQFSIDSIIKDSQEVKNLKVLLEAKDKGLALSTLSLKTLESEVIGNGYLSLQKQVPHWQFELKTKDLDLQPVSKLLNFTHKLTGHASINNQLSGTVQNSDFKVSSGRVQVSANNFEVNGVDLDKILDDFQNTQNVGLLDVGATALLGPAGVLVSKGNDYRNLTASLGNQGSSKVKQLSSDISFSNDIATMEDTAFATEKHRVATKGKIDINTRQFIDFKVATVDSHGCPIYVEEVTGSLDSPTVKKANVLVSSVVNPVSSVVSKLTKSVKEKCDEPFYTGSVKAPVH